MRREAAHSRLPPAHSSASAWRSRRRRSLRLTRGGPVRTEVTVASGSRIVTNSLSTGTRPASTSSCSLVSGVQELKNIGAPSHSATRPDRLRLRCWQGAGRRARATRRYAGRASRVALGDVRQARRTPRRRRSDPCAKSEAQTSARTRRAVRTRISARRSCSPESSSPVTSKRPASRASVFPPPQPISSTHASSGSRPVSSARKRSRGSPSLARGLEPIGDGVVAPFDDCNGIAHN